MLIPFNGVSTWLCFHLHFVNLNYVIIASKCRTDFLYVHSAMMLTSGGDEACISVVALSFVKTGIKWLIHWSIDWLIVHIRDSTHLTNQLICSPTWICRYRCAAHELSFMRNYEAKQKCALVFAAQQTYPIIHLLKQAFICPFTTSRCR